MMWFKRKTAALVGLLAAAAAGPVHAASGQAVPWQIGMQAPAGPLADEIFRIHNGIFILITIIALFVLALLAYVMVKFNAKANPTPSQTSHNTLLEVAWTVIPILILVGIAVPSFRALHNQAKLPDKIDVTVKAIGNQWYWSYEYIDQGIQFDSIMLKDDELPKDKAHLRLLETDNHLVLPVGKNVRLLSTANDVIHAWTVFAIGININSIPGRINEVWFRIDKPGTYYGHCNKICGKDHSFMPIAIDAVDEKAYDAWLVEAKKKFASAEPATRLAALPAAR